MTRAENPYKLRSCVWELTLACCFRCAYCGSNGGKARGVRNGVGVLE